MHMDQDIYVPYTETIFADACWLWLDKPRRMVSRLLEVGPNTAHPQIQVWQHNK